MGLVASLRRTTVAVAAVLGVVLAGAGCVVTQPFVFPARSTPPPVDAARLEAHVRALSERFRLRNDDHPDVLDAAAAYVKDELARAGGRVDEQIFPVDELQFRNVIARFGPDDGPLLVVGAHYDAFAHTPGADDDASGVAGLLELARLLGEHPPESAVELVAYTLEEPPHFRTGDMGSVRHARALRAAGRDVRLMLSLEMIGYFRDEPGSQTFPSAVLAWLYPDRGDFIAVVGRIDDGALTRRVKALMRGASDLPVRSINAPATIRGVDFSDHASYWAEGFPALMITDTAFFRNPNYHRAGDTADTLDYVRMAKVVQGVFAVTHGGLD